MQDNKENNQNEEITEEAHEASPSQQIVERFKSMSFVRKIGVIGVMLGTLVVISFIIFSNGKSEKPSSKKSKEEEIQIPDSQITQVVPIKPIEEKPTIMPSPQPVVKNQPPPPPPELKVADKSPPPPPPLPMEQPKRELPPSLPIPKGENQNRTQLKKEISTASVMAFGGGNSPGKEPKVVDNKGFLGFDGGMIDNTELQPTAAQNTVATKINSDLRYSIVQGKIMEAVLETAINTQVQKGLIRAILSHDVYGEQGDLVLIPKGSRLIGNYEAGGGSGVNTRVSASWNRIITPSGVDINLPETPATDALGRGGVPGYLDTNLTNNLLNALLVSTVIPYVVVKASGTAKEQRNTEKDENGKTTTKGTVGGNVLSDGLKQFQSVAKEQLDKIYPPGKTTLFVDQGTKIQVIARQDIVFPKNAIRIDASHLP